MGLIQMVQYMPNKDSFSIEIFEGERKWDEFYGFLSEFRIWV